MTGRPVIFSDVDGTLCFHEEAHGILVTERRPDGTVLVEDPRTSGRYPAHDVSISLYKAYLSLETIRLGRELRKSCDFVCVTGGRPATVNARRRHFDFCTGVILENGGLIFDGKYAPLPAWSDFLAPERRFLGETARMLEGLGWKLDIAGRTSAIRVRLRDNPHKSEEDFARLCAETALPDGLRKTFNLQNLDIILKSAGKDNAVRFYIEHMGFDPRHTIGIGDDLNDIDFLRCVAEQHVLASAFPEVLQEAEKRDWHVSRGLHFDGIHEVLAELLQSA